MKKNDLPTRFLIKHSGKLLLYFILASVVISSLYESNLKLVFLRFIPVSILFAFVFIVNIWVLMFFENRKKSRTEKTGRKTFLTGWLLTVIMVIGFHFIIRYFHAMGLYTVGMDEVQLERTKGWRVFIYLPYVSLILYTFVFLIQNFILHQFEKNRIEMELLKLKTVNTETTNQLLQQQIQPHFLFNALNILKSLIRKYPQTAEAYLIRLSDFLRASVTRNTSGIATVKDELKLCADYMEMQKIRFGKALNYNENIPPGDDCQHKFLPFFALQPLLENAIKHNELTETNPLTISMSRRDDYIIVCNNLQPKKAIETSTGYGLSNLRDRTRLISGDDILIENDGKTFTVGIKLLENENIDH